MPPTLTSALRRERRLPYLYLAPALLVLGVFGLLPILFTAVMSFLRWDSIQGIGAVRFGGLSNYLWVHNDDRMFGWALQDALWHAIVSGFLIHLTAIPLAAFIDQAFRRWRSSVITLYLLPFLTGGIVIWVIVSTLFSSSDTGLVNHLLMSLGNVQVLGVKPLAIFFPTEPIKFFEQHGDGLGVMIAWWATLGWNVLLYVTALQYVPRVLLDAARIDGANHWQTLRYVIVPQLRPMIFFAASLTLVWEVGSEGRYSLPGYLEYIAYTQGDFGAAAAMAVLVVVVLAALIYLLWLLGGRPELPRTRTVDAAAQGPRRIEWLHRLTSWIGRKLEAPESTDPNNLRGFDGMRALACLMVIVHHLGQRLDGGWALPFSVSWLWQLTLHMDMGVCVFFALSGALLSMPFWKRFLDGRPAPALGEYTVRRAARILPGYWAALTASFLLGLMAIPDAKLAVSRYVMGATFTSALHYTSLFPTELNPVLWSISFEVMCYVLLPLLLLPLWWLKRDRTPRAAMRYLIWVLIGLQFAHLVIVACFPMSEEGRGWHLGLIGGAKEWLPYWSPASFMTQFLLGGAAALAITWKQRKDPRTNPDFDWLAVSSMGAGWALYIFFGSGVNSVTRQPYITPVFPALLAVGLFAMQFGTRVHRALDNRLLKWVGKHSFGLYLWHYPVIELVRIYWFPTFKPFEMRNIPLWLGLSVLVAVTAVTLSWLSYKFLEEPTLRWARNWLARRRGAPAVALSREVVG